MVNNESVKMEINILEFGVYIFENGSQIENGSQNIPWDLFIVIQYVNRTGYCLLMILK